MAGFNFAPITVTPPPQTSLADMLYIARNAQAYQQAQQINPLALEQQKELTKQSKLSTQKQEATLEPEITQSEEAAKKSQIETLKSRFGLNDLEHTAFSKVLGGFKDDPRLNPTFLKQHPDAAVDLMQEIRAEAKNAGIREDRLNVITAPGMNKALTQPEALPIYMLNLAKTGMTPSEQVNYTKPTLTTNVTGQAVAANPVTGQYNVLGTPETNPMGPRSQIITDPVTGNQIVAPLSPQGVYQNPTNLIPTPGKTNNLTAIPSGSTAETVKGNAANAQNLLVDAVTAINDASKPNTHLPTQEYVNKKLLNYLKDPSVQTGPIAEVIAGKTNKESLSAKEQEVLKLIQQRIQSLAPRSDADSQQKKDAYGSFGTKKEALIDLVRQDMGSIMNQKLLKQGILNSAGDLSNPNLPAVNSFQQKYLSYGKDPVLMNYMGIVGTGQMAHVDAEDTKALQKLFHDQNMDKDARKELEAKRKQLIKELGSQ